MSSLLEQAIVDATALKEAAVKNAEKNLIEKYSSKIKEAVDKLLENGEPTTEEPVELAAPVEQTPDAASELENTPTDLEPELSAEPVETQKDPLEKVMPSYLKGKDDNEKIVIDFSSLKAKPVGNLQAGATLPVTPVAPVAPTATPAAPAAPAAPPLAENLRQYEEDEGEIMAEVSNEEIADTGVDENMEALRHDGAAGAPVAEMGPELDEMVEIEIDENNCGGMEEGDCMEEDYRPEGSETVEKLGDSFYEEQEQEESGAYPEEGMEEEISLEEELAVDMDVVSDGWRGMQPNEKREQMNVALAKEQDEEYQRKMLEYEEALEASEQRVKKTSSKNKALVKENEELKKILLTLKEHVEGMNISNAKLLYMNRVLGNPSFNERQKEQIVESISKTETVEAAKIAFETLQSAVGSNKKEVKAPKSLNEAVSRSSSPFLVKPRNAQENPLTDRMRILAGIVKK